jgi:hypothetical protein
LGDGGSEWPVADISFGCDVSPVAENRGPAGNDRGVELCLEYLRQGGNIWPLHPTTAEVGSEYDRIWALVESRPIEDFLDLPLMPQPEVLDTMCVLREFAEVFFDEKLSSFLVWRMVLLSLEHGNADASTFAYV